MVIYIWKDQPNILVMVNTKKERKHRGNPLCYFLKINQNVFNNSSGTKSINNNHALCKDKQILKIKAIAKMIVKIKPVILKKVVFLVPHNVLNTSKTIKDTGSATINDIQRLGIFLNTDGNKYVTDAANQTRITDKIVIIK